jgi:hypothetical protein
VIRMGWKMNKLLPTVVIISMTVATFYAARAQDTNAAPKPRVQATQTSGSESIGSPSVEDLDCSGKADVCAKPVKFLSRTSACVCFTCAYGTPKSRPMCTKSRSEAKSMAALAQKSGNDDQEMHSAVASLGTGHSDFQNKAQKREKEQMKADRRKDNAPQ